MIIVISILIGAVLGTRYKVLCLVPTTLAGTAALATLDQLNGVPLGSTALTALALTAGLQIGYVIGVIASNLSANQGACAINRRGSPDFLKDGARTSATTTPS
jgi:hypothetical protein